MRRWAILLLLWMGCGGGHVGTNPDANAHDDAGAACEGKDVASCRATSGCAADFCGDCNCAQTYMGCRAEADTPAECGALPCPAPTCCEGAGDCDVTRECFHPGQSPECGTQNTDPGDCTTDGECNQAGGEICEPIVCSAIGAMHCVMGCVTQADCPTGTECNPEHRCTSQPCDDTTPCPDDFHCDENFCARDTCDLDVDCVGFCVDGLCYDRLGICQAIPA